MSAWNAIFAPKGTPPDVVKKLADALDKALADLRFDLAANAIYRFVYDRFCDWYLELIKGQIDDETKAVAGWVLDQILVLLHPFMPFITEELWQNLAERADGESIMNAQQRPAEAYDEAFLARFAAAQEIITTVRSLRTSKNLSPREALALEASPSYPTELD